MSDLPSLGGIPLPDGVQPGFKAFTLYDRQQTLNAYAPNYSFPYIQNLTFAVTRNMTSSLTVDVRYVGTLTRKNFSSLELNSPNFTTNGLLGAFDAARRGENPALLDQLMQGVRLATSASGPVVNTPGNPYYDASKPTLAGGEALRTTANANPYIVTANAGAGLSYRSMLANGNYAGLANALNVAALPGGPLGAYIERNGFPVNLIKASPQFNSAVLSSNQGYSNYHSLQMQVTMRPKAGLNFQYAIIRYHAFSSTTPRSGREKEALIHFRFSLRASNRDDFLSLAPAYGLSGTDKIDEKYEDQHCHFTLAICQKLNAPPMRVSHPKISHVGFSARSTNHHPTGARRRIAKTVTTSPVAYPNINLL